MRKILFLSCGLCMLCSGGIYAQSKSQPNKPVKSLVKASTPTLANYNDTISYALGLSLAKFYQEQGATSINSKLLSQAVDAVFHKDSILFTDQQIAGILMSADQRFASEKAAGAKKEGEAFLAKNKLRPGVTTLPDGLQYEVMREGNGPLPSDTSNVKVNYKGMLLSGAEFDNSYKRGEPLDLNVNQVIKGWTEALQLMHEGAKWKIYVPSDLAYGDRGAGGAIPPGATLIFEIELLKINNGSNAAE
ncbi:FKBP-type peptidyl-prolyl cis-trans isomerase FklB [Arachidicoccus rhizosphaerae]|uniref:Peptidyl-prolyl cis-trans isomerase n=1 Tax=Arachidicoccus rhizosphaerae TaxID=551991 RepID=A0A1H3WKP7_9BACT|nr:FKBP-type peptidyl-prolyl cis-trans isomerase [Arachidicoccus rhizosphaerae]SDZ86912.1 FKBP-type peptidyl-prolyl cis-trans isomerase FklB [Arachidicoccus rhizosphaerae]